MSSKHTAGPWGVANGTRICQTTIGFEILGDRGLETHDYISDEEALANARLIAAAPEMLEALLNLVCCPAFNGAMFENDKQSHRAWTLARAVIRKATGEGA